MAGQNNLNDLDKQLAVILEIVIKKLIQELKMEQSPLGKAKISGELISKTIQLHLLGT